MNLTVTISKLMEEKLWEFSKMLQKVVSIDLSLLCENIILLRGKAKFSFAQNFDNIHFKCFDRGMLRQIR